MAAEQLGDTGRYDPDLTILDRDLLTRKATQLSEYRILPGWEPIIGPDGSQWHPAIQVFTNLDEHPLSYPKPLNKGESVSSLVFRKTAPPAAPIPPTV